MHKVLISICTMVWNLAILDIYQKFLVSKEPHTAFGILTVSYINFEPPNGVSFGCR
jgi:hypothetical protein